MNKKTHVIYFILCFFLITASCKREEKTAPAIPSSESINIDFSYFSIPLNEISNYALAYRSALEWKILFEDSLQVYHNLYKELSEKDFAYQDNNTWLILKTLWFGESKYDIKYFEIIDSRYL